LVKKNTVVRSNTRRDVRKGNGKKGVAGPIEQRKPRDPQKEDLQKGDQEKTGKRKRVQGSPNPWNDSHPGRGGEDLRKCSETDCHVPGHAVGP